MSSDPKFITIYHPVDDVQAGLIRGAMEEAGILCFVDNELTAGMRFGGIGTGAATMSVRVPEAQLEQAREVMRELGFDD